MHVIVTQLEGPEEVAAVTYTTSQWNDLQGMADMGTTTRGVLAAGTKWYQIPDSIILERDVLGRPEERDEITNQIIAAEVAPMTETELAAIAVDNGTVSYADVP